MRTRSINEDIAQRINSILGISYINKKDIKILGTKEYMHVSLPYACLNHILNVYEPLKNDADTLELLKTTLTTIIREPCKEIAKDTFDDKILDYKNTESYME